MQEQIGGSTIYLENGKPYTVNTRFIDIGENILKNISRLANESFKNSSNNNYNDISNNKILLIADKNTFSIAGDTVTKHLNDSNFEVIIHILKPSETSKEVHATDQTVEAVYQEITNENNKYIGVVALGSGTINDIAKLSSFKANIPYGVVPTAASMNGYTSAIAAILSDNVKRTVPCNPPVFVLSDSEVIATAPIKMTRSGLGDLLSKPVSSGDWRLSHLLMKESFHKKPIELVEKAFLDVSTSAKGIGEGKPQSITVLMRALLLSGISMALAGSSSPASGGEHLISHFFDMTAPWKKREIGLHGCQVGVATIITATLYKHIQNFKPNQDKIDKILSKYENFEDYSKKFNILPAELKHSIKQEAEKKYPTKEILKSRLQNLSNTWDVFWEDLNSYIKNPEVIKNVLELAGAPTTLKEIDITQEEGIQAYIIAKDIRSRYTILDLAWELGELENLQPIIFEESGVISS